MPEPDASRYEALDLLATLVAVVTPSGEPSFINAALEATAGQSRRNLLRSNLADWFTDPATFTEHLRSVADNKVATARFDAVLRRMPLSSGDALPVHVIATQIEQRSDCVLLEMLEIEQQTRQDREERSAHQALANKELIRNLAHEIKNPLGGIRGAAQLLALEIDSRELTEYTQIIIHEADRLQSLVDRLLAPHRRAHVVGDVNIHEVLERVRSLVLAQHPQGLNLVRDYDVSLPEFRGDREQLIQAVLNMVQNATQALEGSMAAGDARIVLRTRAVRQATVGKQRHRLALELHVEDNGPGIPEDIRERIFFPLVSGREGGSGLGLTLAQTFVQQHQGMIDCDSVPGRTLFRTLIPLP